MKGAAGLVLIVGLVHAGSARAEEGAFASHTGLGVSISSPTADLDAHARASLLLKSTYGISDWTNWEGPVALDMRDGDYTLVMGSGLERVLWNTNHWRYNVGAGLSSRVDLAPRTQLDGGLYVETGLRWLFAWGVGTSLEVHAHYFAGLGDAAPSWLVSPALTIYSEW